MPWVETERQALVETLRATAPTAPTLCVGWDTRHLAAHLVQREHDLLATVGDVVVKREPGSEKFLGRLVADAVSEDGYQRLIDRFEEGPPRWSPFSWAAENINLLEYVVHHEDVRRGAGAVAPRVLPAEELRALWTKLPMMASLTYRNSPVGVVFARPSGGRRVVNKRPDGVELIGEPVELALYLTGRRAAAEVEVTGLPESVAQFTTWVQSR